MKSLPTAASVSTACGNSTDHINAVSKGAVGVVDLPDPHLLPRMRLHLTSPPPGHRCCSWLVTCSKVRIRPKLIGQPVLNSSRTGVAQASQGFWHSTIVGVVQIEYAVAVIAASFIYALVGQAASQNFKNCLAQSLSWQVWSRGASCAYLCKSGGVQLRSGMF